VKAGQTIQLEWKTENADKVHIEPGMGDVPVTGSKEVKPAKSGTYTATATGSGGSVEKSVEIVVAAPENQNEPNTKSPTPAEAPAPEKGKDQTEGKDSSKYDIVEVLILARSQDSHGFVDQAKQLGRQWGD